MRWRPPKNMQTIKKFYESYEDEKAILPVKKNRGVNHVLNTFIESPDVNIDDIDISQKDENKCNEDDTSINEADADITNTLHTVQTPNDTP